METLEQAFEEVASIRAIGGDILQFCYYEFAENPGDTTYEATFEWVPDSGPKSRLGYGLSGESAVDAIAKACRNARATLNQVKG